MVSAPAACDRWKEVLAVIVVLIVGKVLVMVACGSLFGLSSLSAARAGLLLAPGACVCV
jgi:Kef-type K+ transport system membrane component KefB